MKNNNLLSNSLNLQSSKLQNLKSLKYIVKSLLVQKQKYKSAFKAMSRAQIQAYQQKLAHLQTDNLIYQDEISRLRKRLIQLQEYRIKYQLLLQKQNDESPLHRSRRFDEINNMNKKIDDNNDKWNLKIKLLQGKYEKTVHQLQNQNRNLRKLNEDLSISLDAAKGQLLSKKYSSSITVQLEQYNNLKLQVQKLQNTNSQLKTTINELKIKQNNKKLISQSQLRERIQEARNNQKQFYRETIVQLENKLKSEINKMQEEINYWKIRTLPQREQQIEKLNQKIKSIIDGHDKQICKHNLIVMDKNRQIQTLIQTFKVQKEQAYLQNQNLQNQLSSERKKNFNSEEQCHFELMACRKQLSTLHQKQITLLKDSFKQIEDSFSLERQQWKIILKQQQQQLNRIKKMWNEQKQKFMQQKGKLKQKINQLKQRLSKSAQQHKQQAQNQTLKLVESLKKIDIEQDTFNDYQNGITFLHRQLKRANAKIQQKSRQITKLIGELKVQKQQFQNQTQFIKKIQREQVNFFRSKIKDVDQINSKLLEEIRQKDKYIRDKGIEQRQAYKKIQKQNQNLTNVVEEMERDYRRVTDNKKNLYQSYRSERDNVFTGKAELNQEKKRKLLELNRQKNQLQIAYKERQKQIKESYQIKIIELQNKISKISKLSQERSAEVQILKQKANSNQKVPDDKEKQQINKQFYKKVATLDLQISLAKNLFQTLNNVRHRTSANKGTNQFKSQFDDLSEKQSGSITSRQRKVQQLQEMTLNEEDFIHDNVAPTFSAVRNQNNIKTISYPNAGMQVSFFPVKSPDESQSQQNFI